ncbi:MAG: hypothetical protein A2039_03195 [Candidatus Melainabacteria bacterium GWA2_34_9]|nr:MAG: hypothetical protein A2039_03195 [Candidatus Melainabacteria bacterium GWA2_34_9]
MINPKVSVIIPCYNHGIYIDECVESVLCQTFDDFEIIIINDGSTDDYTNKILSNYKKPKTIVINSINQGPSEARNTAIRQAKGEYILPLDADDKLAPKYIEKALKVFQQQPEISVVYTLGQYFGAKKDLCHFKPFKMPDFLLENVVFSTALYKKSDWKKYKGYNKNMIYGWEDFDFWLYFVADNKNFYRIEEPLFYYRRLEISRTTGVKNEKMMHCFIQIYKNHPILYFKNIFKILKLYFSKKHNYYKLIIIYIKYLKLISIKQ